MLCLSACFQAFEVCLENRLFMIEPDLTALSLQQAVSSWKVILVSITSILSYFSDSLGKTLGSNTDALKLAGKNMNEETSLYSLMLGLMLLNAL